VPTLEEVPVRIEVAPGDITRQVVDVVVNAANSSLLGGGGVDGAIHAAAGPELLEECRRLRRSTLPDGLPVGADVAALLASCFTSSLDVAAGLGAASVAFPAISAGAYGWPVAEVARVAVGAVRGWLPDAARAGVVDLVRFVPFGAAATAAFEQALNA
jgi:O-acetyl-ADP-ribose deacetylase (regulator of RNase III)